MSTDSSNTLPQDGLEVRRGSLAATLRQLHRPSSEHELMPWPPGAIGETALAIYNMAPRGVREVAIVAALGLHAGICGRQWRISESGLNLYIVLVAQSAIGKEAMHSGIATLLSAIVKNFPDSIQFVTFDDFASGQALTKACVGTPCFVNVAGEWGHKLRQLADDKHGTNQAMQSLRRVMTDLYGKSGADGVMGGIRYSDDTKNVESVSGVAYSLIGETTPGTFYAALNSNMMADGFLSRLCVIEYRGKRPSLNRKPLRPPANLINHLTTLAWHAVDLQRRQQTINVALSEDAAALLEDFEAECDEEINGSTDESYRQAYNRAALKVRRLCGLLAVADSPTTPVVSYDHIDWALRIVRQDIHNFTTRLQSGDIGETDDARERAMINIVADYLRHSAPASYNVPRGMRDAGIVSLDYLRRRTNYLSSFKAHRFGATDAMRLTIKTLVDSGILAELSKEKTVGQFNHHGKAYRVLQIPE
jgi:hypothetical protein